MFSQLSEGDHAFRRFLEVPTGKTWLQGEVTFLGCVIIAWHVSDDLETMIRWMDARRIRWRPQDQGIALSWLEVWPRDRPRPKSFSYNWDTILHR